MRLPLDGVSVTSIALNLPGPVACARLRELGAAVTKVEPPGGDPLREYCPAWYARLSAGMTVLALDLKARAGRDALELLLAASDLLVTAQRPSALERLGLGDAALARHPRMCRVAIVGHPPPREEIPGHDLTYMAQNGLVAPGVLPPTLFADMAGAERAVSTALALLLARERDGRGRAAMVALADAAAALAQPLHAGLTARGALLGGGHAGYNLYASRDGWIAVAALEPHFARRLAESLHLPALTTEALRAAFADQTSAHWQGWARQHDLPLAAVTIP